MELDRDFTKFYGEFQEEIAKIQANLNYLNDLVSDFNEENYNNSNHSIPFDS